MDLKGSEVTVTRCHERCVTLTDRLQHAGQDLKKTLKLSFEISHLKQKQLICDLVKEKRKTSNGKGSGLGAMMRQQFVQLFLLSAFPGHISSLDGRLKCFQLQQIRDFSVLIGPCSFYAWCISLAATSQPNVLISLESSRVEE